MKNCIFVKTDNSKRYYYPIEIFNIQKVRNINTKFLIDVEIPTNGRYPDKFIKEYSFYSEDIQIFF